MRVGLLASLVLFAVAGGGAAAARDGTRGAAQRHEVQMRAVSFAPGELVIALGDTVDWRNADIVRHNAVRPGAFESEELQPGEHFEWVPADTGTYTYRCTIHARMRGKVVVK